MSVGEHRAAAPGSVACAVVTISDTRTVETDASGRAIVELLEGAGHPAVSRVLVPDEPDRVLEAVRAAIADGSPARAVITTGGTGIASRDRTFEAVSGLIDRPMPGFGEIFRMLSFEAVGPAAMLSRAVGGVASGRALFVLPGSEAAVRLAMTRLILPELGHIARELAR